MPPENELVSRSVAAVPTQAEESVAGDGGREEVPLELVAAELRERRRRHVRVHAQAHSHAAAPDVARRLWQRNTVFLKELFSQSKVETLQDNY